MADRDQEGKLAQQVTQQGIDQEFVNGPQSYDGLWFGKIPTPGSLKYEFREVYCAASDFP